MVSERKREANRKNAQKPRGPRKQKLENFHPYQSFSTFHWDVELLAELKVGYCETLQPQNRLEESLVDMLCHATLRLQRVPYLEHEYHATHPKGFLFNEKENHFGPFYRAESKLFYQQLSRYETGAQRSFYKALDTLLKLQEQRISRRGAACCARPTGQNFHPLDLKRSAPGAGAASGAPTKEVGISLTFPACHPGGSRDPVARTTQSFAPSTVLNIPEDPGNWIPAPAGMTGWGKGEDLASKSQQKTSHVSHQTPPAKRLKTHPQPPNSPQGNRWLTPTLATVSQTIKTFTQELKHKLHQALTGALGWGAFFEGQPEGPRRATLRSRPQPLDRPQRGGEPGSAASPSKKVSHPRAPSWSHSHSTGPDPPDSS